MTAKPIPTPEQVYSYQEASIEAAAQSIRDRLADAMSCGFLSVAVGAAEQRVMPAIMRRLEPVFAAAGWMLIDHGVSISVREAKR
jgi:hypothetical protein